MILMIDSFPPYFFFLSTPYLHNYIIKQEDYVNYPKVIPFVVSHALFYLFIYIFIYLSLITRLDLFIYLFDKIYINFNLINIFI